VELPNINYHKSPSRWIRGISRGQTKMRVLINATKKKSNQNTCIHLYLNNYSTKIILNYLYHVTFSIKLQYTCQSIGKKQNRTTHNCHPILHCTIKCP
jgi:hypothetical protein